jgi:hypothetical protein
MLNEIELESQVFPPEKKSSILDNMRHLLWFDFAWRNFFPNRLAHSKRLDKRAG